MKKVLALILTFALLLVPFSTLSFAATAYTDVTLKSTDGWNSVVNGENWVLYLYADDYASADWSYKYKGFTYEINGITGTTTQVSSADGNRLYCTIPTSSVPTMEGTVFTIKAGNYAPDDAGTATGLNITQDFDIVVSEGHLVHANVIHPERVEAFNSTANSFYFSIKDRSNNTISTGFESWTNFLSPAWCDGTRVDPVASGSDIWSTVNGGVFVDGAPIDYWGAHFKNTGTGEFYIDGLNAVAGTTVTVKGYFASSKQSGWIIDGHFYLKEMSFSYDGTSWNYTGPISYKNITLTSTDGWSTAVSGENWVVYLNTNGFSSTDWTYKYAGFTYEIGGETYTTSQVSSAENNRLYFTVPTSVVSAEEGTVFTVKAGDYAAELTGATTGIHILEDFDIVVSEGRLVHAKVIDAPTVEIANSSANSFYFYLKDKGGNAVSTGVESWTNFLSPAWCDDTRVDPVASGADIWSKINGGVFVDGAPIDYWGAHFKNTIPGEFYIDGLNAVAGTTVTVKGYFASSKQSGWIIDGHFYLKEMTFVYDGTVWAEKVDYTEYEGTPVFESWDGTKGLYFTAGETAFPYDADNWTVTATAADEDSGVFVNTFKTSVYLKKVDKDRWYVCLADAGVVPEDGDEITVAGSFVYKTHRITFEETSFVYEDNTATTYTGTPVLSENEGYGKAAGFYFTSEDHAPYATDWSLDATATDGEANGVFVNGAKTAIALKKVDTNLWYVCIGDAGVELDAGDVISIKGSFNLGNDIVTFDETSFKFNGKRFSDGLYDATEFTITGPAYSDIVYDTDNNRWNMYFTLSNNIPGDVDATYYPYMTYKIDGTEYTTHWFKSSSAHTVAGEAIYNLYFPIEALPQNLEQEYVITIEACESQGRVSGTNVARADGIRLTEDYQFVIGNSYSASAPAVDYLMENGGNANGIYLYSNDDFPIIGWDYSITKAGENDGIYVDGVATNVFLKKYEDGKYYVCLSDMGVTAQEGTIVMLKGKFTTANLNNVTFQTAKYVYTDGRWQVYVAHTDINSTGVSGDANGDNVLNLIDLVRMKKFVVGAVNEINSIDADLNGDGRIISNDITLIREIMLENIVYASGANITGVPTYTDDMEMRLSAYVSPTVQEGFDDYKAAGFTTLISEGRAVYGEDGFEDYMNLAAEKGLDVLVQSGNLQGMLTGSVEYNQAWLKHMCDELSQYSSFRGLLMGDEPRINHLESYTTVTNALKLINPKMNLFTSCLPTYTNEEYLSNDSSLSLTEKYSNYANSYGKLFGEFTYDFYPFRHSYKSILGMKYNEKDYMRSDWFQNLTLVASNGKGAYDTGITVQTYAENLVDKDHYREVTEADVSFQVYSALAYGMKSINYFTYGEHWDESVGTTSCMIYNGEKTDVYYAVQNVNNEIKAFDHVILDFNWQGTVGITGENSNGIMSYVDSYTSKRISNATASNDAIIGCLKDSKGYDGFMLVNSTDPSNNITETISVTFNNADHAKVYINGTESIVELENGTYSATLTPGQGIFVIPYIA